MDSREAEQSVEHPLLGDVTLARAFEGSARRHADRIAQRYKGGVYDRSLVEAGALPAAPGDDYAGLTYAETRRIVRRLAAGFRDLGLAPGDRVGLFAHTRMEWAQTDFAALAAGGAVTTLYPAATERQVEHLLADSGARGVVVENADRLRRVLAVEDDLDLEFVVVIDAVPDGSGPAAAVRDRPDVLTLGDLYDRGERTFDAETYEGWLDQRDPGDLASLVYTSGTTGRPKGVRLTHRNFKSNLDGTFRRFGAPEGGDRDPSIGPGSVSLSFLPLAHVFERLAGHFLLFGAGATVAYAESPDTLREDFRLVRPTIGTSVPRVYEKLYGAIRSTATGSPFGDRLFEWATGVARAHREADDPGTLLAAKYRLADRLVFSRVREAVGGRVDFLISGGGSLSPELCGLFHAMGIPVLEGYGLTETAPVVTANPPGAAVVGTVGPPLVDQELALDGSVVPDATPEHGGTVGELLVRGPNVTDGYWRRPEETAAAFVDEAPGERWGDPDPDSAAGPWFRTGDVVEIRPDGYLVFRERAKQLLKLSTGKTVAPGPIEDAFAASPVIDQIIVLGDGRRFVGALVVPSVDGLQEWAASEGIDLPTDRDALRRDDRVRDRIEAEIDAINDSFEPHERVKRFRILAEEFSEETDTLTPTMKKKRRTILDRFTDELDAIYAEE